MDNNQLFKNIINMIKLSRQINNKYDHDNIMLLFKLLECEGNRDLLAYYDDDIKFKEVLDKRILEQVYLLYDRHEKDNNKEIEMLKSKYKGKLR